MLRFIRSRVCMETILLVDDNPLRASLRKSILEGSAPDVVRALDASEALCLVESPEFASGLALVITPLIGALLGFLYYNFNPASIFLGDCGSLVIGFLLGCYGLMWNQHARTSLGMAAPAPGSVSVLARPAQRAAAPRPLAVAGRP